MRGKSPIQFDEDIRLMIKAKGGDRQAYARLYEKYASIMKAYLARRNEHVQSWDDLVQDVFTRVWEHRANYEPGMAVLPYLLGFVRNVVREHQARNRRKTATVYGGPDNVPGGVDRGPEAAIEQDDLVRQVRSYVTKLPRNQRRAVELVYLAEMPIAEAARVMGCSKEAIWQSLHEGRQRLSRILLGGKEQGDATRNEPSPLPSQSIRREKKNGQNA